MKARTTSNPFLRVSSLGLTAIAVLMCSPQSAQAANLTWDITTGDGATITPGSGTWGNPPSPWHRSSPPDARIASDVPPKRDYNRSYEVQGQSHRHR
ncbi:MAG: hypothetical protein ABIS50_09235 [Luteolibacter sp.]|uniref:hypothetical protein n=1 Tax=Luteolibacter sp. TaxID=1962973 RepID=UPI003264AD24